MSIIDPRRSGAALWVLWVAAGALGGALATLFVLSPFGGMVSGYGNPAPLPYNLQFLAYAGVWAAIGVLFQALLLAYVLSVKKAAFLWLLATLIGASLVSDLLHQLVYAFTYSSLFTSLPMSTEASLFPMAMDVINPLTLGLPQGLALMLLTGRKAAPAIWIVGALLVLPLSSPFAHLFVPPVGTQPNLIVLFAASNAEGAAVTGLALLLVLRLGRPKGQPLEPRPIPVLQSEG